MKMFTHSSARCLVDIWVGRDAAGGGANCVPIHEWRWGLEIISSQMISSSVLNFLLIVPPPTLSHQKPLPCWKWQISSFLPAPKLFHRIEPIKLQSTCPFEQGVQQHQPGLNLAGHLTTRPFRGAGHKIVQNHNPKSQKLWKTYSRNSFWKWGIFLVIQIEVDFNVNFMVMLWVLWQKCCQLWEVSKWVITVFKVSWPLHWCELNNWKLVHAIERA